jgi:hypothetical protein
LDFFFASYKSSAANVAAANVWQSVGRHRTQALRILFGQTEIALRDPIVVACDKRVQKAKEIIEATLNEGDYEENIEVVIN